MPVVGGGVSSPGTGPIIGGGIAGVASTAEQGSIMIYDGHQKYNEWEFVYELAKDRTNAGTRQTAPPVQGGQTPGTQPLTGPSTGQPQVPAQP